MDFLVAIFNRHVSHHDLHCSVQIVVLPDILEDIDLV